MNSPAARRLKQNARMGWLTVTTLDTPFSTGGKKYRVRIEGEQRPDRTWGGRVAFVDGKTILRTGQETSQPDRKALEYWATGLEKVYLEGAFARTKGDKS
jgi:hypothetical protein